MGRNISSIISTVAGEGGPNVPLDEYCSGRKILTFWSLADVYPNNRLRYHLGQLSMIQLMNYLTEMGNTVWAVICDPDFTLAQRDHTLWREHSNRTSRFLELACDKSIKVHRMSDLIKGKKTSGDLKYRELQAEISKAAMNFRDLMQLANLSEKAEKSLARYRYYVGDEEPGISLRPLVEQLSERFAVRSSHLLTAAYASIYRPDWFTEPWLADFSAYLASETESNTSLVMLEADRNAYAWILMRCLFEIGRETPSEEKSSWKWPTFALMKSVPSLSGATYMGLSFPDDCLFLDSSAGEIETQIKNVPPLVKSQYNELFLENQQYIKPEVDEWDAEFLTRFTAWQVRVQEMLHRTISVPAPVPCKGPPVAQTAEGGQLFDVFFSYNSEDKPTVIRIAQQLKQKDIRVWLDQDELRPGKSWLQEVDAQVRTVGSVAILVGDSGIGPWQRVEVEGFIHSVLKRKIPVIPVLLPNATETPELPFYLQSRTYIDFRKNDPHPLEQLVWGIKGTKDNTA